MAKKVMIVEDNELNMKLFRDLIQLCGHQSIEVQSGRDALRLVKQTKPDLILMDIQLPEISGLEIIEKLKAEEGLKDIPIIAVTAFAMKGDEERIQATGCEKYISKPIAIGPFMETIKNFLD